MLTRHGQGIVKQARQGIQPGIPGTLVAFFVHGQEAAKQKEFSQLVVVGYTQARQVIDGRLQDLAVVLSNLKGVQDHTGRHKQEGCIGRQVGGAHERPVFAVVRGQLDAFGTLDTTGRSPFVHGADVTGCLFVEGQVRVVECCRGRALVGQSKGRSWPLAGKGVGARSQEKRAPQQSHTAVHCHGSDWFY